MSNENQYILVKLTDKLKFSIISKTVTNKKNGSEINIGKLFELFKLIYIFRRLLFIHLHTLSYTNDLLVFEKVLQFGHKLDSII